MMEREETVNFYILKSNRDIMKSDGALLPEELHFRRRLANLKVPAVEWDFQIGIQSSAPSFVLMFHRILTVRNRENVAFNGE